MYLEIFLADFAVFRVFLGISRDFAEIPEFRGSATARNIRSPAFYMQLRSIQGCQKVFKQQADNEQQAASELAPKAQVLEGRGIQGHSEIYRFGNGISRGFQEKFSTADTMLFYQNTPKTRNNAVEMSQVFHDIACFKCFTYLNLLEYAFSVIQNW